MRLFANDQNKIKCGKYVNEGWICKDVPIGLLSRLELRTISSKLEDSVLILIRPYSGSSKSLSSFSACLDHERIDLKVQLSEQSVQ